jgi:3-hydroxyisobutyrate dehydrogenase
MGARMAARLIKAGHDVTVWNRTADATKPLVAAGATQAQTPRQAAAGAAFVVTMVRDDEASRRVWLDPDNGALAGMAAGAVAIESSTLTAGWIRELGHAVAECGVALLEAPVSGSRVQADAGQLVYFIGGDVTTLARAEPVLKAMGSTVHHIGPLGSATLVKLSTNALLGVQITVLAELIGLLRRSGGDAGRALQAVAGTAVWSPVANYLSGSMLTGDFSPQFPVELIEKDFNYTVQVAGSAAAAPTIAAARDVFRAAIGAGLGELNMTAVVKLVAPRDGGPTRQSRRAHLPSKHPPAV